MLQSFQQGFNYKRIASFSSCLSNQSSCLRQRFLKSADGVSPRVTSTSSIFYIFQELAAATSEGIHTSGAHNPENCNVVTVSISRYQWRMAWLLVSPIYRWEPIALRPEGSQNRYLCLDRFGNQVNHLPVQFDSCRCVDQPA